MASANQDSLAPRRPSGDYLAELSKHVRGIYYLILVGAAAILLATAAKPERSIEQALNQIDALVRLQDQWNDGWLDELARATLDRGRGAYPNWPTGLPKAIQWELRTEAGNEITFSAQRDGRDWSFRGAGGYAPPEQAPDPQLPGLFVAPLRVAVFSTVNEIKALWDSIETPPNVNLFGLPATLLATLLSGAGPSATAEIVTLTGRELMSDERRSPAMHVAPPSPANLRLLNERFTAPRLGRGAVHTALKLGSNDITHVWQVGINKQGEYANVHLPPSARGDAMLLEIPLHVFHIALPAQETLRDQIGLPLALGAFSFAFAELDHHAQGLGDLPIRQLRDYLASQADSIQDEVEVFGLKFQGSALGSWGLVFLAALQFYFAVSFRNFVELRSKHDWNYPWLALYPDKLSRSLFVLTGFIFPTLIVLMLGANHAKGSLLWVQTSFVVLGVLVSLGSASWSLTLYGKLQSALDIASEETS